MSSDKMPFEEALMGMIAMMIVLVFILIFYCFVPCYKLAKRRQEELDNWWETDPRWNQDRFQFSPRFPDNYLGDKKYSRMLGSDNLDVIRTLEEKLDAELGYCSSDVSSGSTARLTTHTTLSSSIDEVDEDVRKASFFYLFA